MNDLRPVLTARIQQAIDEAGGLDRLFGLGLSESQEHNYNFGLPAPEIRALLDDATYLDKAAEHVEKDLVRNVEALVAEPNREAVLHRLVTEWPLSIPLASWGGQAYHGLTVGVDIGFDIEQPHTEEEYHERFNQLAAEVEAKTGKKCVLHFTGDTMLFVTDPIPHLLYRIGDNQQHWPFRPGDVSATELAGALAKVNDKSARAIAKTLLSAKPRKVKVPSRGHRAAMARKRWASGKAEGEDPEVLKRVCDSILATYEVRETAEPDLSALWDGIAESPLDHWDLTRCALVISTVKQVEACRHIPTVKVSAKPPSRMVVRMLSEGPPTKDGTNWDRALTGRGKDGSFELVWRGKREAFQLALLPDMPLNAELVQTILRELGDDGVRDWFVFHVMAERQGGTGDFNWSWREHREMAGYDRRVANKNECDADLASRCVGRIWALANATLRFSRTRNGKVEWVRVGDHNLVDVPAGRDELTEAGRLTTVARILLNKAIYRGARTGERAPYYALLHERAMLLPPHELRLAAMLAFDWRVALDNGGTVVRKARTLWEYARIRGGRYTKTRYWPEAARSLNRQLDGLAEAIGMAWTVDGEGPEASYTIAPPAWWQDRVIHKVPPVLPASTAGVPRTGAELAHWRATNHITIREAAEVVGVGKDTLHRAEKRANAPLPAPWVGALAGYRRRGKQG